MEDKKNAKDCGKTFSYCKRPRILQKDSCRPVDVKCRIARKEKEQADLSILKTKANFKLSQLQVWLFMLLN